jgi:hypothetical protein
VFWFYLSYVRSDNEGPYLQKFYRDLAAEVSALAATPLEESGFFDQEKPQFGDSWPDTTRDALASARVLVPLFSPRYFMSEYATKEFQIFNSRVERYTDTLPTGQARPQLIMPVLWVPARSQEVLPEPFQLLQYNPSSLGEAYAHEGLLYILKLRRYANDYQRFLRAFADRLVAEAGRHALPRLDTVPRLDEVPPLTTVRPGEPRTPPPTGVFISYRRQETAPYARLLFEALSGRVGPERVFMDVDSIELGVDFTDEIEEALAVCKILLALIGPQWVTITDAEGRRRLEDPDDIVFLEIKAALDRNLRVIPILVDGTLMPNRQQLPGSLAPFARRNGLELSSGARYNSDIGRLLKAVERILSS